MKNRVGIWAIGLAGSAVAHGAVLALVSVAIRPEPLDQQVMPTSELEVQAYQLERVEARQQQPESQKTKAGATAGAQLAAGAIAHSRTKARAPDAEALNGVRPRAETLSADEPHVKPVRPVSQAALDVAALIPDAPRLATALQVPSQALETRPVTESVAAVAAWDAADAAPLIAMAPKDVSVAPTPPISAVVASAQPEIATVANHAPAATVISAVLRTDTVVSAAKPVSQVAKPTAPPSPVLAAALRTEAALAAARPTAVAVPKVTAPAAILPAVTRPLDTLPTARPIVAAVVQAVSSGTVLTATVSLPVPAISTALPAATVPQAAPAVAALPQAVPSLQSTPSQRVEAPQVAAATPNAQRLKAALAFSGGDGDVDPVSVAAFQSFMQPGDIATSGDTLRDGVAGLLAQVPCSRLQVGFDPDTATLQVNGHIPEGDLRAPVLAALRTQMGADIAVSDNILILPRPQCGALAGIAGVGLAQSTDQNTNPLVIGQDAHVKVLNFVRDERLFFDITAPDYAAYVYVDYFDAGGNVLHLAPNDQVPLTRAEAETALRIGAKAAGDPGLQILIGPPYGQEIAVAFAASVPLYEGLRPIQEPAAEYLEWLKARVEDARREHADFKGEWVYFFVTTAEQ